jgi:hypothetical protein
MLKVPAPTEIVPGAFRVVVFIPQPYTALGGSGAVELDVVDFNRRIPGWDCIYNAYVMMRRICDFNGDSDEFAKLKIDLLKLNAEILKYRTIFVGNATTTSVFKFCDILASTINEATPVMFIHTVMTLTMTVRSALEFVY